MADLPEIGGRVTLEGGKGGGEGGGVRGQRGIKVELEERAGEEKEVTEFAAGERVRVKRCEGNPSPRHLGTLGTW